MALESPPNVTGPLRSVPAVAVRSASRTFRSKSQGAYTAVKGVSFDVRKGEFLAVVGPSGCGKSTILGLVSGLQSPTEGDVRIFDEPLVGINSRAAYLFQNDALLPWKTVVDNVALGLVFRGEKRSAARETATKWLSRVGLAKSAENYPHQLSGGMRRRVAMAQTWIVDPDILLMDEPFSALDVQNRQAMGGELLNLWQDSGKTVIFVTHDLDEAITLADRVLVLSAGPASRPVGEHLIDLERPRSVLDIRTNPHFTELYDAIWDDLRHEVIKSQEEMGGE